MSTIVATQIKDLATEKKLGVENVIEGTAKCWVLYGQYSTGGVPSVNDSFNIASVTDDVAGKSRPNTSTPFRASSGMCITTTMAPSLSWDNRNWSAAAATNTQWLAEYVEQGINRDPSIVQSAAFGDLA